MKERPIIFSAPMVRAILSGRKTQTRRLVKPAAGRQSEWLTSGLIARSPRLTIGRTNPDGIFGAQMDHPRGGPLGFVACPYYGQPGDRLWVGEAFALSVFDPDGLSPEDDPENYDVIYRADPEQPGGGWADSNGNEISAPWKPSIHMPRWASRILLEITAVRVERLQEISEADALAEGIESLTGDKTIYHWDFPKPRPPHAVGGYKSARDAYTQQWVVLNGRESLDANPWVWVIEFKRV